MTLLAAQAAVAIENVRLLTAATRWSERLESLNEIGNALATETDLDTLLDLVARRLRELLGARLRRGAAAGRAGRAAASRRSPATAANALIGATVRAVTARRAGACSRSCASERVDSVLDDPEVDPGRHAPARRDLRALGAARRARAGDRRARRARQGRTSRTGASATTTCAWPRRSPAAPRLRSTSPSASRGTRSGASSPRRSSSGAGSRASCTTRPGRRSRRSCSASRGLEALPDPARAHEALAELRELAVATLRDVRRLAVDLHPKTLDDFGLVVGARAAARDVARADGDRRRPRRRASATSELSRRGRDRALPDRAGGARRTSSSTRRLAMSASS